MLNGKLLLLYEDTQTLAKTLIDQTAFPKLTRTIMYIRMELYKTICNL